MTDAKILKGIDTRPLMPAWLGLCLMVASLGGAWYREGDKKAKAQPATPQNGQNNQGQNNQGPAAP
jgi:hypothetical protein